MTTILVFLQEKSNGWPRVLDIYFENNDTAAYAFEQAITIEETGMYYLWFVTCDEDLSSATVRGHTTWKNPTGQRLCVLLSIDVHMPCVHPLLLASSANRCPSVAQDPRQVCPNDPSPVLTILHRKFPSNFSPDQLLLGE